MYLPDYPLLNDILKIKYLLVRVKYEKKIFFLIR